MVVDVVTIGADVVVVIRFSEFPAPEQSGFPSPIISVVAASDLDILPTCASNEIYFNREFINCGGGI